MPKIDFGEMTVEDVKWAVIEGLSQLTLDEACSAVMEAFTEDDAIELMVRLEERYGAEEVEDEGDEGEAAEASDEPQE